MENRLKQGMCVVEGCGNASAVGSEYCASANSEACDQNEWSLGELAYEEWMEEGWPLPEYMEE